MRRGMNSDTAETFHKTNKLHLNCKSTYRIRPDQAAVFLFVADCELDCLIVILSTAESRIFSKSIC